jgi:MFS family permease
MKRKKEISAVYSAGLIQGIALVAFPAASTIFTDPHAFHFSSTAYGSLFIPQAVISIIASLLSMKLNRSYGSKMVFLSGLIANFIAMGLLALSSLAMHHFALAYGMLLVATGFLGLGFGLTVPTLNTVAALLYPNKVDSTLLILNALLGVGTALAPAFIALFINLGFWWGLPVLLVILITLLFLFSLSLTLPGGNIRLYHPYSSKFSLIPSRFWIFAAFALLYGIIETLNGNWISIYMSQHEQATIAIQSLALATFWGMVTLGRILFALIEKEFKEPRVYQILPFIAALAFIILAALPSHQEFFGVFAFGVAGFGCSALLPLTISFAGQQLHSIASSIAGGVIAFYLLGYGIAAFGVGPLQESARLNLREIYAIGIVIALILGALSYLIVKNEGTNMEEEKV